MQKKRKQLKFWCQLKSYQIKCIRISRGYGFCFLAVGNNQSLKAVERTNGIEFQGLNDKFYINLFNKISPDIPRYCVRISISSTASCSPNVSEELVILSLNKIGKTLLKSIKNDQYIKFNSESKLLVYRN